MSDVLALYEARRVGNGGTACQHAQKAFPGAEEGCDIGFGEEGPTQEPEKNTPR
jgi:hypothetical protein